MKNKIEIFDSIEALKSDRIPRELSEKEKRQQEKQTKTLNNLKKKIMGKKKRENSITIKENDWETSKFKTKEWARRVNITRWEHDFEKEEYNITLG